MGNLVPVPARPAVPDGMCRICVAGFGISCNVGRAQRLAKAIAEANPEKYETWFYFSTFGYRKFLKSIQSQLSADQLALPSTKDIALNVETLTTTMATHSTAPFIWLEWGNKIVEAKGGRDMFAEWAAKTFPDNAEIQALSNAEEPPYGELFFDNATPGGTYLQNVKPEVKAPVIISSSSAEKRAAEEVVSPKEEEPTKSEVKAPVVISSPSAEKQAAEEVASPKEEEPTKSEVKAPVVVSSPSAEKRAAEEVASPKEEEPTKSEEDWEEV